MDINLNKKNQAYVAFIRLVKELDLDGPRKLAKALGLKEKEAKDLLSELADYSVKDLIEYTKKLIALRK